MEQTTAFPPRYSNLPEALPGTYPVATAHDAPEVYKSETTLQNKNVPWWRRYWILLLALALVIAGGAIGGGVGGALATRKNDSQVVATPVGTRTGTGIGLGVTTTSISSSASTIVAPGTVSTTSSTTQSIPPQTTMTVSASTVSISSPSTSEPPTRTIAITISATTVQTTIEVASVSTTTSIPAPPPPITTTTTAAVANPTPTPAPGTRVYIGQNAQEQVAFLYHDACKDYVFLEYLGTGVCERPFTLSDSVTYTVHGCGGTPWVTWGPGTGTPLGSGTCVFSSTGMPDCPEWNLTGAWICG